MLNIVLHSIFMYMPPEAARETVELISSTLKKTLRADPAIEHLAATCAA